MAVGGGGLGLSDLDGLVVSLLLNLGDLGLVRFWTTQTDTALIRMRVHLLLLPRLELLACHSRGKPVIVTSKRIELRLVRVSEDLLFFLLLGESAT